MKNIMFIFLLLTEFLLAQRVGKPMGEYFGIYTNQLKVGNAWTYRDYWWIPLSKIEIIDTAIIENQKYFKLNENGYHQFLRLRKDGYYVVYDSIYGTVTGKYYIYYKKNAQVGDFWAQTRFGFPDSFKIYHKVIGITDISTFWGTWITTKMIEITDSILTSYIEYWSEDFGLVRVLVDDIWAGGVYFLWGCVINDTVYGDTTFTVSVEDSAFVNPTNFELYQNYPNPFNAVTMIKYSITKTSHVKLKVYDILGNEVSVLVDEVKPPGNYSVEFYAEKLKQLSISSGTYFYELSANGQRKVKKMALIK